MDVEVAALQDDCDWWFAHCDSLVIQEEVPEESLRQGGAPSSLEEDPPCVVAVVGYVSMT